jgi:hypothetical protein
VFLKLRNPNSEGKVLLNASQPKKAKTGTSISTMSQSQKICQLVTDTHFIIITISINSAAITIANTFDYALGPN